MCCKKIFGKSEQQYLCLIFKNNNMKKIFFLLVLFTFNMSLLSCDSNASVQNEAPYENLSATEGEDGEIEKDPDAEPEDGN